MSPVCLELSLVFSFIPHTCKMLVGQDLLPGNVLFFMLAKAATGKGLMAWRKHAFRWNSKRFSHYQGQG